ncbi:hypothetical protein IF188_11015 [Microbacterium sp. NEAU-LLC]|uniref:Lipoprotein n=1 Tax=Microbacterium helvum TaxID=2773713 RepID=A0ABR8NNK9_9MICO|nr:hypothetical protein [Microbacterium helvum]MBD3942226.1 hypothetical protein [Microbacterium helvum]
MIALTAVGMLLLAGCSAAPEREPALPSGVSVELQQLRSDVSSRQAEVHVTNGSDAAITIGEVRIEDARFEGPSVRVIADRVSSVPAGGAVDIRVQLAPVACDVPDDGDARVVLQIVGDAGTTEVEVSAPDPVGFVAPLHARECLEERVADAAGFAFTGFTASAPGEAATLELTVTPTGSGEAAVTGIERTNLIDFAVPGDDDVYPLDLEASADQATPTVVAVPIIPFRCDPHAVQEDKRGTIFDVQVVLDGQPGEIELFVGEELRGRILTWVGQWCGFGGSG